MRTALLAVASKSAQSVYFGPSASLVDAGTTSEKTLGLPNVPWTPCLCKKMIVAEFRLSVIGRKEAFRDRASSVTIKNDGYLSWRRLDRQTGGPSPGSAGRRPKELLGRRARRRPATQRPRVGR